MSSQPPTSSPEVRLLPLVEGGPNEALANTLARLLIDDPAHAKQGAEAALLILTGVQIFLDSGGDIGVVDRLWEPNIVARELEKAHGATAWQKAKALGEAAVAENDERRAFIYNVAAAMLMPDDVNKQVDSPA